MEQTCENCKYWSRGATDYPCVECSYPDGYKWESAESVNHPKHYTECSIECIEAMQIAFGKMAVYNFCICNAFKYLWRYKNKNGSEDLNKAEWYLNTAEALEVFEDDITLKDLKEILEKHRRGLKGEFDD